MSVLENARQERFAQLLAAGKTATAAYVEAGYKPDDGASSRLSGKVRERVAELLSRAGDRVEITKARVIRELALLAFSDLKEFADWNESGVTWKPSDKLTDKQSRALASIKQTMNEHGGTTELKLYDKQRALELLGKELGMFTGKEEPVPEDLRNMTTDQLIEALKVMQ